MDTSDRAAAHRFVVDAMLGRLAHWLRAMGYDTAYLGPADDQRLLAMARAEGRILVTRDGKLAALAGFRGCLIRTDEIDAQLAEAVRTLGLSPPDTAWLSRCLECNTPLEPRDRQTVRGLVPERIFAIHAEFRGCPGCGRLYWAGSHADRMVARLTELLGG